MITNSITTNKKFDPNLITLYPSDLAVPGSQSKLIGFVRKPLLGLLIRTPDNDEPLFVNMEDVPYLLNKDIYNLNENDKEHIINFFTLELNANGFFYNTKNPLINSIQLEVHHDINDPGLDYNEVPKFKGQAFIAGYSISGEQGIYISHPHQGDGKVEFIPLSNIPWTVCNEAFSFSRETVKKIKDFYNTIVLQKNLDQVRWDLEEANRQLAGSVLGNNLITQEELLHFYISKSKQEKDMQKKELDKQKERQRQKAFNADDSWECFINQGLDKPESPHLI
jgi:hypothetical protein